MIGCFYRRLGTALECREVGHSVGGTANRLVSRVISSGAAFAPRRVFIEIHAGAKKYE